MAADRSPAGRARTGGPDPRSSRRPLPKPVRVLIGMVVMLTLVAVGLGLLARQAGAWGVPFFSFTTEGGSTCTNQWAGYSCEDLTTQDVETFADLELPTGSTVIASSYTRTHDYSLTARFTTNPDDAEAAGAWVVETFGSCAPGGVPPADLAELEQLCVVNSDINRGTQDVPSNRRWLVSTGVGPDGVRTTEMTIASR